MSDDDDAQSTAPAQVPYDGVGARILEWYMRFMFLTLVASVVLLVLMIVVFVGIAALD